MKKVLITLVLAVFTVGLVVSCEKETEQTYDQIEAIDKDEVEEDDI